MSALPIADTWFERTTVAPGITMLIEPHVDELLRCNIWHVRGRTGDLLVDTGLGVASLRDAAADLFEADLLAVATHAHMDHAGGIAEFEHRAIHASEADAMTTAGHHLPLDLDAWHPDAIAWLGQSGYDISAGLLTAVPKADFSIADHDLIGAAPTRILRDGDVIDLGDRAFEVLHLPGHTTGSIGLYDRKARLLFSGDAIYDGALLDDLPESNIDDYVETMLRLRALPVDVVHGGHGDSMSRARFNELIEEYLESKRI